MPDFPKTTGATPAQVWAYATRELSGDSGNVVRDAILSDATRIPGADIDAAVSSRADGADYTSVRAAKIDAVQNFTEEGTGTLTASALVQTVREYVGLGKLHCYVDMTDMDADDIIIIAQSVKIGAAYVKYAEETYSGVQTLPMLHLLLKPGKLGVKVTLQQTAQVAGYKDFDWETFLEAAA